MNEFNPTTLKNLNASLEDDSTIVEVDDNEIWRITHMEVRQRCASLKLASRVIGMATATTSGELDDASILHDLQEVLQRLSLLWEIGLPLVGADRKMPDFPIIFNVVTNIMLDVITEAWKWSRLESNKTPLLSTDTIGKLLDSVIKIQPERFECTLKEGLDLAMTRRLCVLEAIPKLYSLANIFDYYQTNIEMIVEKLLYAVTHQAEQHANLIGINKITFAQKAIWQLSY